MATPRKTSTLADPFKLTLLIFAVIAFMYFTGEVLKPLALAVLLSFALAPAARLLERGGVPRPAAAVLTIVITLGLLGGISYVVGQQLTALANRLPGYQGNIEAKISRLIKPGQKSASGRLKEMADQVTAKMERPAVPAPEKEREVRVQKVEVVQQPSFQERLRSAAGPYLEFVGVGSFVLILALFILIGREQLSDRSE
jgi:predicted PurR-regulated permease PerM